MSNTRNAVVIGGSGGGLSYTVNSRTTYPANVTSITIPDGVKSIETYAFYGCSSLASITLPSGVTSIGDYAFYICSALMKMTVLASTPPTLGTSVLVGVPADCSIRVPAGSVAAYQAAPNWSDRAAYITAI